jgi:16S rRNA (uracil1498-N3)-methyltransferase
LLKKDRFDLVLEKACELGVARIQPVLTRRCVADKLNMERARATLTEAAEQCARTALPRSGGTGEAGCAAAGWDIRALFFADEPAARPPPPPLPPTGPAALLTGPEGGLTRGARRHPPIPPRPITLGPRILR